MPITRECDYCQTPYTRPPALVGKFCSAACGYKAKRKETPKPGQYRMLYKPDHPLRTATPYLPEHRVLLYERIGPGVHHCHHCDCEVAWAPGARTMKGALVVDHLDRDRSNNAPANLAPSCQRCNMRNTIVAVRDDELYVQRAEGTRSRAVPRDCEYCGGEFLAIPNQIAIGNGRFCSRSCARRSPRRKKT